MKKNRMLRVGKRTVPLSVIRRKRHKTFTLSVHEEGRVVLTVPKRTSEAHVIVFLQQKMRWLLSAFRTMPAQSTVDIRGNYKLHKEAARALVLSRLEHLNKLYGFTYSRVTIRANRTRWGSCSTAKNLNFDYRILFLPNRLRDYLLVHELCHLREMNHSKRFWMLVSQTIPDYATVRKELRRKNNLLGL